MTSSRQKKIVWIVLYSLLFFLYFFLIWNNFSRFTASIEGNLGYLDIQENWRALDEFVKNRVFFKDYYFTYGWFLLFLQSFVYKILNQSHLAVIVARQLFLPLLGVILALIIGKNILKKTHYVFIFLFFNLFYGATMDFSPVRHLIAELALSFFIVYLFSSKKIFLIVSGVIAGLSLLTALEYGIPLNIALAVLFLMSVILKSDFRKKDVLFFFVSEMVIVIPFIFYLHVYGALQNYLQFMLGLMNNFYFVSPCNADSFPRLYDVKELIPKSMWLVRGVPIEFLQRLNMYVIPIFYILIFTLLTYRYLRRGKVVNKDIAVSGITVYGLLVYLRTLDTPCIGYFRYGLVPFFLLVTVLIGELFRLLQNTQSKTRKISLIALVGVIFFWFTLNDNTGIVQSFLVNGSKSIEAKQSTTPEKKLNKKIGWPIDKKEAEEYEVITAYIKTNTSNDDTLFVYPWGPYNNLTELRASESVQNSFAHLGGEKFVDKILIELEDKKPEFVVASLRNSGGNVRYGIKRDDLGLAGRYYSVGFEHGPVFSGNGDKVQKYILENYQAVFHNDAAIVMQRREKKVMVDEPFQKLAEIKNFDQPDQYSVAGDNSSWKIVFTTPVKASDFEIEFKMDGDIFTKRLSRYFVNFYVDGQTVDKNVPFAQVLARKEWQKTWISLHSVNEIKSIELKVAKNNGLVWWFNPYRFEVDKLTFYNWKNFLK